jgi:serine/threonine protein kinase
MQHPASIGKYDLEEFLGGGMSQVYRARDRVLGRSVAIKILTPQGCEDPEVRDRFLLEARMAGNISHENVISIYDFGEEEGKPFLVMEFLRGRTLRSLIKERQTGDTRNKLWIALQLGRALEYIHTRNIVHRDIKPENVHVNDQGCVKLMDFGIAKAQGLAMTQAGFVLGTPYYMAPEQVRGEEITPLVDVYGFGVLLYELFTGEIPYKADSAERIFYCIIAESPSLEKLQQESVPMRVQELILWCMKKVPAERPKGFAEVCATIEGLLGEYGARAGASAKPPLLTTDAPTQALRPEYVVQSEPVRQKGKSFPWWMAGVGGALIAGVVGVLIFVNSKGGLVKQPPALPPSISTTTGEMVLVRAGQFLYGEGRAKVNLPAFYVDKTEVSNAAYASFCKVSGCDVPVGEADLPVTHVTVDQARKFAQWAGKRLPSDQEWEKAARGTDGRRFPWGDDPDITKANLNGSGAVSVNSFPQGQSPYGALQMAGNVLELVDTPRTATPAMLPDFSRLKPPATLDEPWVTLRGGGYSDPKIDHAVTWAWLAVPARLSSSKIGFRCVQDPNK